MIEKGGGTYVVECDFCSNYFDTEEHDWVEAIRRLKDAGWKITKKNDEWLHQCDACQGGSVSDFEDVS